MNAAGKHVFRFCGSEVMFDPAVVEPPPFEERPFPVTSLALDVSGSCNMRCIYCAESSTMPQRPVMSRKILEKAVDSLFACSHKRLSLHVGSGEPLLQADAVREIGRRARNLEGNREVTLHLTTNGTLLTEDICHWLVEDRWKVKVSLDGSARIHDQNRKDCQGRGTYQRIEGYVRRLSRTPAFSTTSVLCHGTDPKEVFYGIGALGVKNIEIVPVATVYPSPLALTRGDIKLYCEFLSDYVQKIARGESLPLLTRFMKRLHRVLGFGNSRVPCGAGRNFMAVAPDGELYPCFRFVGIEEYRLGHVNTGVDPEKAQKFALEAGRPYDKRENCKKCWAAPLCGGPCFACAQLLFHKNGEPSPDYCDMVTADCKAAVWLAQTLREEAPENLVELLGICVEED
ncbi:MAG: hypothetical protein AYK19_11475 [Theionarchaea archaeon DG-70-1]|nr:MAG: hypothetical protein AYK19_11475 [Theionarchaea archaeon DG-70-1]